MRNTRLLLSAVVAATLAAEVAAETASTTLDVTVALQPALTLTCSGADFGVIRVQSGARGGEGEVVLSASNQRSITFGSGVSLGAAGAQGASCTLTGSSAPTDTEVQLTFLQTPGTALTGAAVNGADAPVTDGGNVEISFLGGNNGSLVVNGTAIFNDVTIGIKIPDNLTAANFGGYSTQLTVSVDDGV
ncbi:MAG: hypothetical protein ACE37J_21850 [Pikeienuella sp.]|uniref:hypothetical protein n=1 Tax=Pikeienuella sp. TaxID=2831957 RepID=UPI00391C9F11